MMKRRGFIGMFGAALASGPEKVAKLAGIGIDPLNETYPTSGLVPHGPSPAESAVAYAQKRIFKFNLLKQLNPGWFTDKRRAQAKYVGRLDLDLASMHSVSLAGKVAFQRERQFQRSLDEEGSYLKRELEEEIFSGSLK